MVLEGSEYFSVYVQMIEAHPIKGVGGEVEDHSKATGLGEVFRPHACSTNFPLSHD